MSGAACGGSARELDFDKKGTSGPKLNHAEAAKSGSEAERTSPQRRGVTSDRGRAEIGWGHDQFEDVAIYI